MSLDALDQIAELLPPLGVGWRQRGPERGRVDVGVDLHAGIEQTHEPVGFDIVVELACRLGAEPGGLDECPPVGL